MERSRGGEVVERNDYKTLTDYKAGKNQLF